jgi:large subunit ribosomal protein L24
MVSIPDTNAPLHLKQKLVGSHLSKDLITKHKKRSLPVRKGDKVVVTRGQHKDKSGKIERVSVKRGSAFVSGIETIKKDGSKALIPIHPSNLMITELNLEDKRRLKNDKKSS